MIVVYILLFIVFLSVLIMVHEAGHLMTAKIFKVYCFEYAIGFGPKLFSKKRKNGETYFSIRAIPFGGFVSMYGESDTVPEGLEIDPKRSLLAIAKWKRAIIMAAGVIMNFVLAIVMFFVYEVAFPTYIGRYAHVIVNPGSLAYNAGVRSGDRVYALASDTDKGTYIFYDDEANVTLGDSTSLTAYLGFNYGTLAIKDTSLRNHAVLYENLTYSTLIDPALYTEHDANSLIALDIPEETTVDVEVGGYFRAYNGNPVVEGTNVKFSLVITQNVNDVIDAEHAVVLDFVTTSDEFISKFKYIPLDNYLTVQGDAFKKNNSVNKKVTRVTVEQFKIDYPDFTKNLLAGNVDLLKVSFNMSTIINGSAGRGEAHLLNDVPFVKDGAAYYLPNDIGVAMQLDARYNNFGEAIKETFVDFGDSATMIFRGLVQLVSTKDGWRQVGGIIAIGVTSTQILQQNGFGVYLRLWAIISVNLGIVNLLPFPGLDGWHLLVLFVEGVFRKEIPPKVKNIVSAVGIGLLFLLMVLIIVKDIMGLF